MTKFIFISNLNKTNGWGMPMVQVKSNANLKVINRGYNEFECTSLIDESDLLQLRTLFPDAKTCHLEITTPARKTNCWYNLRSKNNFELSDNNNIVW